VQERGLAEQVTFKGFVDDTASIYAGACATLQTSESEGFGMALLESLSNGVPVVAYDVSYGAREAVRDGVDGFVVPWGDRPAMAERLLAISSDPELRARLGAAAPAGAARFSSARYVREWDDALASLPQRTGGSTASQARVVSGALELRFGGSTDGVAVLRARGRGDAVEEPVRSDTASLALPVTATGDIYDVFLRTSSGETRVRFSGQGGSDDPTWRVYGTEYGNLSIKKVSATVRAAADGGSESLGNRALRRIRRTLAERVRPRSA
jgi:poly(glycerol-phosphate) alpha-glucosyltransferase